MAASKYPVLVTPWAPLPRPSRGTWRKEWLGDVELAVTENTTMAERWPEYVAVEPIQAHEDRQLPLDCTRKESA